MNVLATMGPLTLTVLKAVVWVGMCWLVVRMTRRRHPALQVLVCRASLMSLALLIALALVGPQFPVAVTARPESTNIVGPSKPAPHAAANSPSAAPTTSRVSASEPAPAMLPSPSAIAIGVWLALAVAFGVRLGYSLWTYARFTGTGVPADDALERVGGEAAALLRMRRVPRLRITPDSHSPLVLGLLRPVVLLPRELSRDLRDEELRGVLLHEFSHARSHDLCWKLGFEAACAMIWFHPGMWALARAHTLACEKTCDAAAAALCGDSAMYRRVLARVALRSEPLRLRLAITMARPGSITQRVRALASPAGLFRWDWRRSLQYGVIVSVALTVFAALSCYRQGPGGSYEKAPIATGPSITLGPTTFTLNSVARWSRDGTTRVGDGYGRPSARVEMPEYPEASKWMDIAEIVIGPEADVFDVTELRVFDHATQENVAMNEKVVGGYQFDGRVARVVRIGNLLPDELDVWMRVRHRPAKDPVWRIPAEAGSSATIDGVPVVIREIHGGAGSYEMRGEAIHWTSPDTDEDRTNIVVVIDDPARRLAGRRFQLCIVDDAGKRYWSGFFVSVNNGKVHVPTFPIGATRVKFVELSPLHEERRFYFEGVKLPPADPRPMQPPPTLSFAVNGKEGEYTTDSHDLLRASLTVLNGDPFDGVRFSEGELSFSRKPTPGDDGTTIAVMIAGLGTGDVQARLIDASGQALVEGDVNQGASFHPSGTVTYWHVNTPVEDIARVDLAIAGWEKR